MIQQSGVDKRTLNKIINNEKEISASLNQQPAQINNGSSNVDLKLIENASKLNESVNDNIKSDSSNINLNPKTIQKIVDVRSSEVENVLTNIKNHQNYFGYDIFKSNPELFQNSIDLSVDPNYVVGPGDEVIIMLWGETELNQSYLVTRDGYLHSECWSSIC